MIFYKVMILTEPISYISYICRSVKCKSKDAERWKNLEVPFVLKGQLISKANCQAEDSSKKTNEMNLFLLVCDVFLFFFWKKLKTSKKLFEIVWPLAKAHLLHSSFIDGWSSDKSGVDSSPSDLRGLLDLLYIGGANPPCTPKYAGPELCYSLV